MGFRVDRDGLAVAEMAGDQRDEASQGPRVLLEPVRVRGPAARLLASMRRVGWTDATWPSTARDG